MSNTIKIERNGEVKLFGNQQQVADHLGVTKQAVSKALKNGHRVNGAELSVLYRKCGYTDQSKTLIIDGQIFGTYDSIKRKGGNIFIIGFKEK